MAVIGAISLSLSLCLSFFARYGRVAMLPPASNDQDQAIIIVT